MKKINIHFKIVTTVCCAYCLFISGLNAQTNFLPSDIAGLKLWLTGDSVSITTAPFIDKCFDLSADANHAIQSNSAEKPSSSKSVLNGHKSVHFDGTNDILNFNMISDVRTVFWVVKEDSAATNTNRPLLGNSTNYNFYRGDNQEIWNSSYTNSFILSGATRLNITAIDGATKILPQQYSILSLVTTGNVTADNFSKDRANANRLWSGDLMELIIYNQALSASQVKDVENYLHYKYAPPVQLGADQVVCSLPVTLKAKKSHFIDYKWQDNSTADSLVVNASGTYYVTTKDIFNITSTDTVIITKDTTAYSVKLGNDTAICSGQSLVLYAGPPHLSYVWSTGSTENTITVNASGDYAVSVTDCLGNVSKDTINVNIHPIPLFNLGADTLICFNSMYTLDPGFLNSTPYSFSWFDGTTDSVHAVTHGGSYYLKVNDNIGCAFSDTIQIKMDSLLSNISLGADTTFCSGNIIGLKQGGTNAVSFLWSTGSNSASIPVITTGQYWLTVKSINNCSATDTINVTVSGKAPVSDFVFANTCLKNVTQFTDQSIPPSGETISAWDWTFGDSFGSATPNPIHVYADTGKYTVQLTVTTLAGCAASFSKVISIFPKPQLNFLTSTLCEDINVAFTGQATTFGAAIKKWSWNFADPASGTANTSTLQNPVHLFASGGMYAVSLIGENIHGCPDTISKNINVNSAPVTDFSYSIACKDDTVFFKDATVLPSGTTNIGNYWSFGNGSSVLLNPNHVFPANVLYNVMHVVTASNGCKDTVIKKVDVHASPTARFVSSTSCEAAPTDFTDQSFIPIGSIVSWEWTFENKDHSAVQNPSHSFLKAGNVLVKQLVTSDFGCKDSISKTLVVYPKPTAQFTATPNYGNPGQSLKFTNTSSGAVSYVWNFDDGNTSTVVNPTHIFKDIGEYHPSLVAISTYGCKDSATTTISILKRFIDVAINDATVQVQNGGGLLLNDYLNVHVNLTNKSTSDLFVLDLYMEANDGTAIKETWTGKFLKGDAMGYDFKATPSLKPEGHFICVYALYPNGLPDEVPGDNKFCKALDEGTFKILPPYPNPTEDLVVIPLIIPNNGELMMTIYDSRGKQIQIPYEGTIAPGLQLITIDTREFNSGLYVCKAELDGQKIVTKFIKQ